MKTRGATRSDVGPDVLDQLQGSLTVSTIMTPRDDLETCRRDETARSVMARNEEDYSFFPVVDDTERKRFLGLYRAERWFRDEAPDDSIREEFELLSEDHVIGADASIIEFVTTADERPARLVVSGDEVTGLVTLSDLQRLPVRAAIFALITSLELAMSERIEAEWPDDSTDWLELLSPDRRENVEDKITTAKREDGYVSAIVLTQISDKATILRKQKLVSGSGKQLKRDFKAIRKLRDKVAHASYYAETPKAAYEVCEVVRRIGQIHGEIRESTSSAKSASVDPSSPKDSLRTPYSAISQPQA